MSENQEEPHLSARDAIETVADEGLKRNLWGGRPIRLCFLAGVLLIVAMALLWWIYKPANLAKWPVAVLLPETQSGSVATNAKRQLRGFEEAFTEHGVDDSHRFYFNFEYPISDGHLSEIRNKLDEWYKKEGIRTFIITMSGATELVKPVFTEWIDGLPKNDRPVLIATVASAPGLVDRKHGVFRHYIRSKDESGVLATYIESINAHDVGVFHVNDEYGESAKDILKDRFLNSRDTFVYPYLVGLGKEETVEAEISRRVQEFNDRRREDKTAVAVIIGYGSMIEKTLAELNKKFNGEILVVSTFTEEKWRPTLDGEQGPTADRVRFVGPGTLDDNSDNRGVVFQFSYLTLDRALRCRDSRGVESFWDCWTNVELEEDSMGKDWADVEFTQDGDSHISLRLLKADD